MEVIDTKKLRIFIIVTAIVFYVLEGVIVNPFFLWVATPLGFAYFHLSASGNSGSAKGVGAIKGFLFGSIPLLLLIHVAWALDIDGTKTGGSTSALIFAVAPVYAFITGGVGYVLGRILTSAEPKD